MAYQDKKEEKEKKAEDTALEHGKECPDCGGVNESEAKFCGECGYDFSAVKRCSKCGAKVLLNADICEACGEWLLEGQCKFCYAPLEPEAKFCSECGNPVEGVECPQCHRLSCFDFCKDCNIPLTRQAQETIEAVKGSEEFQSILEALKHSESVQSTPSGKEELQKMKRYKEEFKQPQPNRKIFSLSNQDVSKIDKIIQDAQKVKREYEQKQEKPRVIEQSQQKSFANNQEARRFYGALKILLPYRERVTKKVKKMIKGWRCNAYNAFHPDGPQECADPSHGGEWVFEEFEEQIVEEKFKEVEI